MLATHTPKFANSKIKCDALSSRIIGDIPEHLICSKTVDLRREVWAAPRNAAHIKKWRDIAENLPSDFALETSIPGLTDPVLKQVLLPVSSSTGYISVTPVASMGLLNELFHRLRDQDLPFKSWSIQPTPAARSNHGESLLMQGGSVRMLRRGAISLYKGNWTGDFVQLTARCEGMNASSGMVAAGFPAITAIGGFVHSIERQINQDIKFAVGIVASEWIEGVKKTTATKSSSVRPLPSYVTEEMTTNGEIVLLLKGNGKAEDIANILKKTYRLAGGSLFDVNVSVINNGAPPHVSYLIDASSDISASRANTGIDSLQAALDMYSMGGSWENNRWQQLGNGYTLNHTGYAFLEAPQSRQGVRGNYLHAWAEPTFSLITQSVMTENAWWTRKECDSGVYWQ